MALIATGRKTFIPSEAVLVGKDTGAQFQSIGAACTYAAGIATDSNRMLIQISTGMYAEDVVLPDFVGVNGQGSGVTITGTAVSGGTILDVGQGCRIQNITVGPTQADKDRGIRIRNATMIMTESIPGGGVTGTLIVNGKEGAPGDDETFTFAGENTATLVVGVINATAVNVLAFVRDTDKVAIVSTHSSGTWQGQLIVYGTGTANTDLGLGAVDITQTRSDESVVYLNSVSIIGDGGYSKFTGGYKLTYGYESEDSIIGSIVINGLSITGANQAASGRGMVIQGGSSIITGLVITGVASGGIGIELLNPGMGGLTQLVIGSAFLSGNSTDFDGAANTKAIAMLVNDGVVVGSSGFTFQPFLNVGVIAGDSGWNFNSNEALKPVFNAVLEYTRKQYFPASAVYGLAAGGASMVDKGTVAQGVWEFTTGLDEAIGVSGKHIQNSDSVVKTSVKCRVICSVDVNGGALDVVRVVSDFLSVADSASLVGASAETLTQDVDVSTWIADERHTIEFAVTNAGALPDPDDFMEMALTREGTHLNDTYGNNFHVWGIETEW